MIPSRLFSINEQEELNAIYIIALLKNFGEKCDMKNLIYAFYLLKNGDFTENIEYKQKPGDFIANIVSKSINYPAVISQPLKKGVAFLLLHKLIKIQKIKNTLFYYINEEKISNFVIPDKVDSRAQIAVSQIKEHKSDKLKSLFRKQEHLYE